MQVLENYSLKSLNTFGIDVNAQFYASFSNVTDLKTLLEQVGNDAHLILGGGSNILFTKDYNGWILKNNIVSITKIDESDEEIWVKVGAGENWHSFVLHCIEQEWAGIENMSLIPGVVGAAPIQNIGAYGVEQKDVFVELSALNKQTLEVETINATQCKFGYRDSIFKTSAKGKYVILDVTYKLSKKPALNTSYGAITEVLNAKGHHNPTIRNISDAVIAIRQSKLPDPNEIGNAGSFFKNPVISEKAFQNLLKVEPEAKYYPLDNEEYKIPAGWLIEYCGFKGMTKEGKDIGVHQNQALVLVNYGNGKGTDLLDLSQEIIDTVNERFGIELEREVNVV